MTQLPEIIVEQPGIVPLDTCLWQASQSLGLRFIITGGSGFGWSRYSALQKCPYLYYRRYVKKVPREGSAPRALEIGGCFHAFMACYYQRIRDLLDGHSDPTPEPGELCDFILQAGADAERVDEAWRVFQAYANYYESIGDYLEPLAVEVHASDKSGKSPSTCRYDLVAKVDKKAPIPPGTYVVEHKCLHGDSVVEDRFRGHLTLREVFAAGGAVELPAWNPTLCQLNWCSAEVRPDRVRDVYRVKLCSGRYLDASDNHPFLTARGWVPAAELSSQDWVATPLGRLDNAVVPRSFSANEVEAIGYLLGDGSIKEKISFCNGGTPMQKFKALCDTLRWSWRQDNPNSEDRVESIALSQAQVEGSPRILLESLNLYGCGSTEKFIPNELLSLPTDQVFRLLSGLWNTDGCVDVFPETRRGKTQQKIRIAYGSRSERLCRGVQTLLGQLGLPATVRGSSVLYNGERRPYWTTKVVTREGKRRFLQLVRDGQIDVSKYSPTEILQALTSIKEGDDRSIPCDRIRASIDEMTGVEFNRLVYRKQSTSAFVVRKLLGDRADELLAEPIYWDRVESVMVIGREMTYDVSVPTLHTFVANGIITHNTSSRMDRGVQEGWHLDGEIMGQLALWKPGGMTKRFGKLQGVIVNVVTKTKFPNFHREIVSPPRKHIRRQIADLKVWRAQEAVHEATGTWPRALHSCWGRYGPCENFEHCRDG